MVKGAKYVGRKAQKLGKYAIDKYKGNGVSFKQAIAASQAKIMKSLNNYSAIMYGVRCSSEFQAGDHVYILLSKPIVYEHHGIYVGDNRVLHFCGEIIMTDLNYFSNGKVVRKAPDIYVGPNLSYIKFRHTPQEVCNRAYSKLGTGGAGEYNLVTNNCEHFAAWCKCG